MPYAPTRPDYAASQGFAKPRVETEPELHHLLTVDDVARLLKVSKSWVYEHTRMRHTERLPHIRIGKYVRFDEHAVRAFLARQTNAR